MNTAEKEIQILELEELLPILYEKINEKISSLGTLEALKELEISTNAYYDLKRYLESGEKRKTMYIPIGIKTIKSISSALGIEYINTMHCVKI